MYSVYTVDTNTEMRSKCHRKVCGTVALDVTLLRSISSSIHIIHVHKKSVSHKKCTISRQKKHQHENCSNSQT